MSQRHTFPHLCSRCIHPNPLNPECPTSIAVGPNLDPSIIPVPPVLELVSLSLEFLIQPHPNHLRILSAKLSFQVCHHISLYLLASATVRPVKAFRALQLATRSTSFHFSYLHELPASFVAILNMVCAAAIPKEPAISAEIAKIPTLFCFGHFVTSTGLP